MARAYFDDAETIARMLEKEGEVSTAAEFRSAIASGSTGTEILMRLNYQCREALDAGIGGELTRARIHDLAEAIQEVLA